jgi:uncharacterized cofD-like protein
MRPGIKGLKLVVIGGGTGLETLLRGIKSYLREKGSQVMDLSALTAVVTVADDGGMSGRLIDAFGIIPPGDIRSSLAALSDEEDLISKLFRYRLEGGGEFEGHSFGNLFLTALAQMNDGNFLKAIQDASKVLRVEGTILPATLDHVILVAELEDGSLIMGEPEISKSHESNIKRIFFAKRPKFHPQETSKRAKREAPKPLDPKPLPEVVEAIEGADAVVIGPGGLYTSILPVLLVKGIANAIKTSKARKIYIVNVMTQAGRTDQYSVSDHIHKIMEYGQFQLDYVLVNSRRTSDRMQASYREEGASQILFGPESADISSRIRFGKSDTITLVAGTIIQEADLITEVEQKSIRKEDGGEVVESKLVLRHDPRKLASALMDILAAK